LLPEARFVHLIRDGRDVALSMMRLNAVWAPQTAAMAAYRWTSVIAGAREGARGGRHYLEVRYEDLGLAPEPALRRVRGFLARPFAPARLDYGNPERPRVQEIKMALERPTANGPAGERGGQARRERLSAHLEGIQTELAGGWRRSMTAE